MNWTNASGTPITYQEGSAVVFNTPPSNSVVTLNTTVNPAALANGIALNNTAIYTVAGSGSIAGVAGLTKSGSSELILATANTYSGGTTLNAGTVRASGTDAALGTGPVTVAGSATLATASGGFARTLSNPITVNSGQTLSVDGGYYPVTLTGPIVDAGTLQATSSGVVTVTNAINGNGNIQVNGSGTFNVNGPLSGSAALTVPNASGTLAFGGTSTGFTGPVNLNGGAAGLLLVASGANLTTTNVLNENWAKPITVNGTLSVGAASVSINSTMALSGSGVFNCSSFTIANGTTVVNDSLTGTFTDSGLFSDGTATTSTFNQLFGTVTLSTATAGNIQIGTTTNTTGNYTLSGGVLNALNSDTVIAYTGAGNVTVSAGTASLKGVKFGSGVSSATGTLTLSGGTLKIGADGISNGSTGVHTMTINLGSGTLGTVTGSGGWSSALPMTLTAATTPSFDTTGGNISLTGILSGGGSLTKAGANTLTLNAAESYTGATAVKAGTLALGASGTLATTPVISLVSGGVFDISAAGFTLGSAQVLTGGRTASPATDINGNLTSSGTINIAGTGTNGTLTINGNLSLTGGNLAYDLGASSDQIALSGTAALSLTGTTTIQPVSGLVDGTYTLINNIASVTAGAPANLALAGGAPRGATAVFAVAAPAVTLTVSGTAPSSLVWRGTNGPNWDVSTINWDNSSVADRFYSMDNVSFDDSGLAPVSLVGTLYPSTVAVNGSSINNVFGGSGSIAGAATLSMNGGSTLTISNANSFTGGTTINAGTVKVANSSALGVGPLSMTGGVLDLNSNNLSVGTLSGNAGTIKDNYVAGGVAVTRTLTVNQVVSNTFAGVINNGSSNTVALVKNGPGYLKLTGADTFTGLSTVNGGTLELTAKSGDVAYVVTNGATLKIGYSTGGGYANTAMTIYGDGTSATTGFYLAGGKNYNVSGAVVVNNAPTTIRQYGSGLANIGIFDFNSNPGLSITAAASGSVIDANIQMVNLGYGMVLTTAPGVNNATGDLIINGPLGVTGSGFFKRGTGSVLLNGVAASANGGLQLQAGTVICGVNNCIGTNASLPISSGATLIMNGYSQSVPNVTGAGVIVGGSAAQSTLTINTATTNTFTGAVGGIGLNQNNLALVKLGAGQQILSGTLTYKGSTTVGAGSLVMSSLPVADGATLSVPDVAWSLTGTSLALGTSAGCTLAITGFASASSAPIVVTNLATAGTVTVTLNGTLALGEYPLIKYSGTIGGAGINAFQLLRGMSGYITNRTDLSQVDVVLSGTAIYPLAWKGNVNTNWDINTTTNWAFNILPSAFMNSDTVQFDDTAVVASTNVVLNVTVSPSALTVTNNSLSYTLSGNGALAGTMGLTKFGSNTMTLLTTNTYTGVTTISGGTVSIPSLNNGGLASPLGAATNSPTSIVLDGGTLAFTSPATNASNRGFTLTTNNGTIAVTDPSGIQVFNGAANSVTGAGSLTKTGNGTLTLSSLNNYSGTTVVNGGKLVSTVWEWYGRRGIGSGLLTINSGATAEFTQVHGFGVDIGGRTAVLNGGHLQLDSGNYVAGFTMTGGLVDSGTNIVTLTVSGTGMNVTANAAATTAVVSNGISAGTYSGAVGLTLVASNGAAPIGLEMDGNLADGGIALNLTKNGAGTVLLTGTNTYTGNTTINGGTLILSNESFSAGSPIISLANGANLNISGLVNPFVLGGGQTLKGSGTLVGAVSDTPGTTFTPGGITNVGTLHFSSDLTLAGNETLNFDLGKTPTSAGGTNSDQLTVVGNLTINSGTTVNVNPIQLALAGGRYTLIAYSGTLINPGSTAGWALNDPGVVAGRVTGAYIDESIAGEIDLVVSGSPATLVWQGDGAMNAWDVQTTFNWLNGGSPDQYYQLDNVLFDDTGSASPFVDLQSYSPITPSSMVVSNNTKHYIINSTYGQGIDGGGTLTKNGTGTLTFLNSNPYTGLTTINAGTLELGDGATADGAITASPILDNATLEFDVVSAQNALTPISGSGIVAKDGPGVLYLGSGANAWTGGLTIANGTVMPSVNNALPGGESVTVTAGGAYDFNGINNGGSTTRAYSFTIAGNGTGGGALVNNGASVVSYASVSNLTLSADATLGGGGRWDIGPVTNSTMNGNHHILTSMGSQIDFRAQVMTNLENIQITAGNVWYEGYSQTNPWTATMTNYLASGAVLGIYGSQIINAPIVSSGGTINNKGSGTPVWSGFVDAEQPTTLSSAGGSLVFAGTLTTNLYGSTSGSFTVSGNNTISFAGTVKVPLVDMSWTAGTVQLGYNSPSGSIPDSAVTVPAGATFSVYRSDLYTLTNVITGDGSMSILGSNGIVVNAANITIGGTLSVGQGAYGKMLVQPGANITANGLFLGNPGGVGGDVVQSGGILTTTNAGSFFRIGHWGTESSSYTMSGGILNVGGALSVGWDGNGTLTQSGGFIQTTKLTVDDSGNGPLGIYTLTGGTNLIGVGGITSAGTYLVNLGGGTIAASTNWSSSLNLSLTGTNGSTVFDTGIYTNTFSGAFAGAGGLVKNGSGSLVLSSAGAYTYTNDTFVNAGTLTLSGTAVAGGVNKLSSGTVWVSPGAALNLAAAGQFNYASGTPLVVLNAGTLAMTDGQYNYIKNLTMTNGATWALGTGQLVNGLTGANFNLTNVTSLASANTSVITSRGGAIAAASGVTFNVARGTAASDLTVSAALTDYNGTPGAVTKTGNGILTLNTADTYTGTTTVSAGTLALGTFGSLGNTTNIVIAGSALLDVSAASLALGSSQTLGNGTGTGLVAGNVSVNSGKLALAFAGAASVPSLQVTNGNLTLSPSSAIKVNNTGSALPAGSYKLISKATGGAVAGTVPASVTVSGGGLASGMTASLQITSGELYLVVVSPVNTTPAPIVSTTSGSTLTLTWPTDHQGWRLQVQTNNLTTGISTNWYDWPGSTNTTSVNISMDPNAPTVFFRMIYP